ACLELTGGVDSGGERGAGVWPRQSGATLQRARRIHRVRLVRTGDGCANVERAGRILDSGRGAGGRGAADRGAVLHLARGIDAGGERGGGVWPRQSGATVELTGGIHRVGLVRTRDTRARVQRARRILDRGGGARRRRAADRGAVLHLARSIDAGG